MGWGKATTVPAEEGIDSECHPFPAFLQRKDGKKLRTNADTWFRLEGPTYFADAIPF
jgi:hypothetical protein